MKKFAMLFMAVIMLTMTACSTNNSEVKGTAYKNDAFEMILPDNWGVFKDNEYIGVFTSDNESIPGFYDSLVICVTDFDRDASEITQKELEDRVAKDAGHPVETVTYAQKEFNGEKVLEFTFVNSYNGMDISQTMYIKTQNGKLLYYAYTFGGRNKPADCDKIYLTVKMAE